MMKQPKAQIAGAAAVSFCLGCLCLFACGGGGGGKNNANTNGNNNNQQHGVCGNGEVDPGEECDEGAQNSDLAPDACRTNCRLAHCGDGVTDSGEACDSGASNGVSPDPCRSDCTANVCGDGYVGGAEVCDDGNTSDGDDCRGDCGQDMALCGNGTLDPGEGCDAGGANSDTAPNACRTDCQPARCGDGVTDTGEKCDDGNTLDDLTCSADCQSFCGDGTVDAHLGEECDHGAGNSDTTPNACRAHCRDPWCGDGVLDTGEECDVGADNGVSPSPCRETCIVNVCGDGYLGGDEVCDDGNTEDGDDCRGDCGQDLTLCGNGVLDPGEQCDDGATGGGDGCDATCQVEQGWICTGAGATSVCSCAPLYTGDDCDSCVVFVSQEGTVTPPDGQSWASAFPRVQEGIDAAQAAGPGCEVWVARGTYYTYENDANDTLHLRSGVSVYGGFAGTETQREDRNPTAQLTLLDGRREGHLTTHVNTVITAVDVEDALLDGFTVSFGQASGVGGGMRIEGGSPSVTGCTFSGNQAPSGAGMYISGSTATITACTFSGNTANGMGGGLLVDNASPALTGCTFSANEASDGGGGVWVYSGSPILTACTFVDNEAINSSANGGGILIGDGSAVITGCVFSSNSASVGGGVFLGGGSAHVTSSVLTGNRASSSGGGLYVSGGTPRITASIIAGNVASTASNGSGVYAGGASLEITGCSIVSNSASAAGSGIYLNSSSATLTNSVLWGNPAPGIALSAGGSIQVAHSAVEGDHPGGTMIIQEDPDFVVVPGNSGTWASVTFDAVQYVTALESTTAHWAPGSLAGLFVQPNASDARWFPIADNTEDTLWVHGDLSDVAGSGVTYSLHDLHLSADSPCIDAGYGCTDPAGCEYEGLTGVTVPETPLWDLQGNHPHDAGKSASNGGAGTPDYLDMGAHEWRP